jgi:uncharacterized protein YggE
MDKLQKQILFWAGLVFIAILGVFVAVSTAHTLDTATTTNTVSFTGEGKVLAKPDVGIVDLSIVTEGTTSKQAQDANSKKSKALTDFLAKQGVDEKDIKTSGYNIYPQYKYAPYGGTPSITGYQVNQSVQVKVRDLTKVDAVLDGVVSAGVNQVNGLQLTIDNPEKLKDEAREKAIKDAKEKADSLKSQLGIGIGRIVNFSENTSGYPGPIFYDKAMNSEGRGGGGPSIPVGENEITVSVSITYQIK